MSASASRRRRILDLIVGRQTDVEALGAVLDVSLSTIRRDLARLAQDGQLLRIYGGAAALGGALPEQTLAQRIGVGRARKQAIARYAASVVEAGETIILDAGTTTGALATALRDRGDLRVVTNGLTTIQALAGSPGVELIALGGLLRQIRLGFVGSHAERAMRRISAAKVFLGAEGVVAGRGHLQVDRCPGCPEGANDRAVQRGVRFGRLQQARPRRLASIASARSCLAIGHGCRRDRGAATAVRDLPYVTVIVVPDGATT